MPPTHPANFACTRRTCSVANFICRRHQLFPTLFAASACIKQRIGYLTMTENTPLWLSAHREASEISSNSQRGWLPGQSGNPKGRPVGSRNKQNVVAEEFAKDGSKVARIVMDAALAGDMQAASLVLQRMCPPLRARAEKVTFLPRPDRRADRAGPAGCFGGVECGD